jgi:hypothetical protein
MNVAYHRRPCSPRYTWIHGGAGLKAGLSGYRQARSHTDAGTRPGVPHGKSAVPPSAKRRTKRATPDNFSCQQYMNP